MIRDWLVIGFVFCVLAMFWFWLGFLFDVITEYHHHYRGDAEARRNSRSEKASSALRR